MKYLRFPLELLGIGVAALILAGLRIASLAQGWGHDKPAGASPCMCRHWGAAHNAWAGCSAPECPCLAARKP